MKYSFFTFLLAGTILSAGTFDVAAQTAVPEALPEVGMHQKLSAEEMHKKMEERHKKMAEKLAEDLKLSDEQRQSAQEINEKGRKEMEPMMEEMKNIREKMDEKRKINMQEFEKILTPEQKAKFESLKEEYKKKYILKSGEHHNIEERPWLKKKDHHGPKMGPRGAKFEQNTQASDTPVAPNTAK